MADIRQRMKKPQQQKKTSVTIPQLSPEQQKIAAMRKKARRASRSLYVTYRRIGAKTRRRYMRLQGRMQRIWRSAQDRYPGLRRITARHAVIGLAAMMTIAAFGYVRYEPFRSKNNDASGVLSETSEEGTADLPKNQTPEFSPLLPSGMTAEDLGGFTRISPPNAAAAYTFIDRIGEVPVRVTQQELPEVFKPDTEGKLKEYAERFNAKQQLVIDGISAYIGTSEKGPQSVLFIKNDLLVLIASEQEILEAGWVQYIVNLE
jgi:hypothetical protein